MRVTTKKPKTTTYFNWEYFLYPDDPDFNNEDYFFGKDNFHEFHGPWSNVIFILEDIYDVASFINFFVNLPHLFVLLQKELRTNLVYIIMIGICLCDLTHSIGKMVDVFMKSNIVYTMGSDCLEGFKYYHVVINLVAKTMQIVTRRCAGLLALFIAVFRAFSVIFPMSNALNFLTRAKSGYLIVFLLGFACTGWGTAFFVQAKIIYSRWCQMPNEDDNYPIFMFIRSEKWEIRYRMIDSFISVVISFVYVIVAIALVITLFQAQKRRRNLKSEKSSSTSMLVMTMAMFLFLSEISYGSLFVLDYFFLLDFKEQTIFEDLEFFALTLQIISSIAHCFICFLMSSQYRDVVKRLICIGKKKEEKIAVVESSAHATTVDTTNTSKKTF